MFYFAFIITRFYVIKLYTACRRQTMILTKVGKIKREKETSRTMTFRCTRPIWIRRDGSAVRSLPRLLLSTPPEYRWVEKFILIFFFFILVRNDVRHLVSDGLKREDGFRQTYPIGRHRENRLGFSRVRFWIITKNQKKKKPVRKTRHF